jgi:hypothetical protein
MVYQGSIILGDGFTVDQATSEAWLKVAGRNEDVVFPYLIAKEVNNSPSHAHGRLVVNFFDWSEDKARSYRLPYEHVARLVRPDRTNATDRGAREKWWLHLRSRPELYHLVGRGSQFDKHPRNWNERKQPLEKVLVFATQATKYPCFTLVPNIHIYSNSLCVIASDSYALLTCLSSDIHAIWAWEHGSRMKQDLRYTHGDVFETFPFPEGVLGGSNKDLSELGERYFHERATYMVKNEKGLTKFYNDLHDPNIETIEIRDLRELQVELNTAVLHSYGFDDLNLSHGFHNVGYLPEGKNTRFTICEEAREELLYRLALLNKAKHENENENSFPKTAQAPQTKKTTSDDVKQVGLFDEVPVSVPNTVATVTGNAWGATSIDQILAWLDAHKGWYSKTSILAGCQAEEAAWDTSIAELIRDGDIESRAIDGVTRYRAVE